MSVFVVNGVRLLRVVTGKNVQIFDRAGMCHPIESVTSLCSDSCGGAMDAFP